MSRGLKINVRCNKDDPNHSKENTRRINHDRSGLDTNSNLNDKTVTQNAKLTLNAPNLFKTHNR